MDQKLRQFVALLHPPAPPPARRVLKAARPHPFPTLALRRRARPRAQPRRGFARRLADLPLPCLRLWINVGSYLASAFILSGAVWLAVPRLPQRPMAVPLVRSQASPAPGPLAAKLVLPFPESDDGDEQGEMSAPDPVAATLLPAAPARAPAAARATQLAALPPLPPLPPPAPHYASEPPWLRFAVPVALATGRPRIAIVIDDLGLDKPRTERTITLPAPLTLSFLAYASDLPRMTSEARHAGHELMVHVPMEPLSRAADMGPNGLAVSLAPDEVLRRLRWDLGRFDGYVGINNHMGSRFTRDAERMAPVIAELKARGLLFLDSRTIANSAGIELARRYGVPHAARDVFLDNEVSGEAIATRLAEVEQVARRHGSAIAIGHPHDATLDELQLWLKGLHDKGFVLVPVSEIVREHWMSRGDVG